MATQQSMYHPVKSEG